MPLTTEQQSASDFCLHVLTRQADTRQCVLAGYAGAGKTYTTQSICRTLIDSGYNIAALAHTHKALSVLSEKMPGGVSCMTIASALGWRFDSRTQSMKQTGKHKLHLFDCVIVDESSMVDDDMMQGIQRATDARKTPVLWVGDPAQVPPVGFAESPVWSRITHQTRLTEIARQAEGSPIIEAAHHIRQCIDEGVRPDFSLFSRWADDEAVTVIPSGGRSVISEYVASAIESGIECRVVCHTNKAVEQVNRMVMSRLHPPGSGDFVPGDTVYFSGRFDFSETEWAPTDCEAIICSVDDEDDSYGILGIPCYKMTAQVDGVGERQIWVPKDKTHLFAAKKHLSNQAYNAKRRNDTLARQEAQAALAEIAATYADTRHIYAGTVHKAQGSTYEAVIVDWADINKCSDDLQFSRLLYVAVTRPSKYLIVVG